MLYNGKPRTKSCLGLDLRVFEVLGLINMYGEMFINEKLTFKEKPTMAIKEIQE